VQRLLFVLLVVSCLLWCAGCGNVFVGGAIRPGVNTVSGLVSIVQLTIVDGTVQVTFVTFLENGTSSTFGFCGDQRNRFPMNQNVRTNFNPGQPCGTIVTIVLI
jgi:hypothetical protein